MQNYFSERGERVLQALTAVADEMSVRPAQVALAWLLTRPGVTAPIASATNVAQLDEILGSVDVSLPDALLTRLDEASQY